MQIPRFSYVKAGIKEIYRQFRKPQLSDISSAANNKFCTFLNGKEKTIGDYRFFKPGIRHFITAVRFQKELLQYNHLRNICTDSSIAKQKAILNSIPKRLRPVFQDIILCEREMFFNSPQIKTMAQKATHIRKLYDKFIDRPIAKVRSKIYFAFQNLETKITDNTTSHKTIKDADMEFLKKALPIQNIKIPENMTKEELQQFLHSELKKSYSEKEIEAILERKSPVFYRFVDETELRAMKNGERINSTADYNSELSRTDITSDPNYNFNKYRITFKPNKEWNPYKDGNSRVEIHDNTSKKWWLDGGYTKDDVLCYERVKFNE